MSVELGRERLVPMVVAFGLFMENLDSTVLSTALPAIAQSLEVNPLRLNLAITAYLFSLAVFIPVSGWMADRFGAQRVFRGAIAVFLLGSILCGLSQSLPWLVGARIFQGLGGAMMVPVGRLVVLRSVPRTSLVRAMAYRTVPALLARCSDLPWTVHHDLRELALDFLDQHSHRPARHHPGHALHPEPA